MKMKMKIMRDKANPTEAEQVRTPCSIPKPGFHHTSTSHRESNNRRGRHATYAHAYARNAKERQVKETERRARRDERRCEDTG
jgi:hypothetical protein